MILPREVIIYQNSLLSIRIKNYSLEIKFATDAITKIVSSVIARVKVFEFAVKG